MLGRHLKSKVWIRTQGHRDLECPVSSASHCEDSHTFLRILPTEGSLRPRPKMTASLQIIFWPWGYRYVGCHLSTDRWPFSVLPPAIIFSGQTTFLSWDLYEQWWHLTVRTFVWPRVAMSNRMLFPSLNNNSGGLAISSCSLMLLPWWCLQ